MDMNHQVALDELRGYLRLLRDQPMGLERMEAELLKQFREWHRQQGQDQDQQAAERGPGGGLTGELEGKG